MKLLSAEQEIEMNAKTKELKRFRTWFRQVRSWTAHGLKNAIPYALLVAILFGILYLDDSITSCKEQDIRGVGLLFQIAGFTIIVLQLDTRRRLFRKPSFLSRITAYWRSFPSPFVKTVNISMHASAGVPSVSASLRTKPGPNTTLERRIEILEDEVEELRQHLRKTDRTLSDHKAESKRSFDEVQEEIRLGDNKLEKLIDEAIVGGIGLEWIGILYFIVGITLATGSADISIHLGYAGQCSLPAQ